MSKRYEYSQESRFLRVLRDRDVAAANGSKNGSINDAYLVASFTSHHIEPCAHITNYHNRVRLLNMDAASVVVAGTQEYWA